MKKTQTKTFTPNKIIDDLRHEDLRKRITALAHLPIVVKLFQEQRLLNQLIPYLHQFIDDEDQVVIRLIEQLSSIAQLLKNNSISILDLLFKLMNIESMRVRESIAELAARILLSYTSPSIRSESITKLLGDPSVYVRIGSLQLAYAIGLKQHKEKSLVINPLIALSQERKTKAIRSVCRHLSLLSEGEPLELACLRPLLQMALRLIVSQELDQIHKVSCLQFILQHCQFCKQQSQRLVKQAQECHSWRIKLVTISKTKALLHAKISLDLVTKLIFGSFKLDQPQLMASAVQNFTFLLQANSKLKSPIIQQIKLISQGSDPVLRKAVCNSFFSIVSLCNYQAFQSQQLPVFSLLMQDPNPQNRFLLFNNFCQSGAVQLDYLRNLSYCILRSLLQNKGWRIRLNVVKVLHKLLDSIGDRILGVNQINLVFDLLQDKAYQIRRESVFLIQRIFSVTNLIGFQKIIKERFNKIFGSTNYLFRITAVQAAIALIKVSKITAFKQFLQNILERMKHDPIQNVREKALTYKVETM